MILEAKNFSNKEELEWEKRLRAAINIQLHDVFLQVFDVGLQKEIFRYPDDMFNQKAGIILTQFSRLLETERKNLKAEFVEKAEKLKLTKLRKFLHFFNLGKANYTDFESGYNQALQDLIQTLE